MKYYDLIIGFSGETGLKEAKKVAKKTGKIYHITATKPGIMIDFIEKYKHE